MTGRLTGGAVALAVLLMLVSACSRRAPSPWDAARADEPIVIEVQNDNFLDVNVYVMPDGNWHRLGTVTGAGRATFEATRDMLSGTGTFRLLVSPIGSRDAYLSEDILAMPGDRVRLRVGGVLRMSSWSVRRSSTSAGSAP
jgi:hypothetical protein